MKTAPCHSRSDDITGLDRMSLLLSHFMNHCSVVRYVASRCGELFVRGDRRGTLVFADHGLVSNALCHDTPFAASRENIEMTKI
jgi:hypothetical protein